MVKREALEYLTSVYAAATWDRNLDASAWAGLNLLLEACRESAFKGFVKSFLLNYALAQRFAHLTVTPRGVMDAFFNPAGRDREDQLYRVDYLFLLRHGAPEQPLRPDVDFTVERAASMATKNLGLYAREAEFIGLHWNIWRRVCSLPHFRGGPVSTGAGEGGVPVNLHRMSFILKTLCLALSPKKWAVYTTQFNAAFKGRDPLFDEIFE
jgi:hypothetical protein